MSIIQEYFQTKQGGNGSRHKVADESFTLQKDVKAKNEKTNEHDREVNGTVIMQSFENKSNEIDLNHQVRLLKLIF